MPDGRSLKMKGSRNLEMNSFFYVALRHVHWVTKMIFFLAVELATFQLDMQCTERYWRQIL